VIKKVSLHNLWYYVRQHLKNYSSLEIKIMRVAVTQFATTTNVQENLATCLRMINEAAACEPSIIVLPEFCNTLFHASQPCYAAHDQAWDQALTSDGYFLQAIAEQAKNHHCYIVLNVTVRRKVSPDLLQNKQGSEVTQSAVKGNISVTSCLFSPQGGLIHQADKQTLSGYEKEFFISPSKLTEVATIPFGKLGFLIGNDDITFKPSRNLALSDAQLLCHSMNTFALDQCHIHGPARAYENKVFLATANKVGALAPDDKERSCSEQDAIPQEYLVGIGQSQIVAPNGTMLAKISHNEEGFTFADIDLTECDFTKSSEKNNKNMERPDGTALLMQRRPELYRSLTLAHEKIARHTEENKVPATANVAIFATYKTNEEAIEDVCHYIENNLSDIIQLPELFFIADKAITNDAEQLALIANLSQVLIDQISIELRPFQYVCTSLVIEGMHQAVLINEHGLFATQKQLHFCERYQWTALGDDLNIIELPLEQGSINLTMLTADDAHIPELVKVAALHNIHLLLLPFDIQEPSEVEYGLLSRAAENRVCIVAASSEKNFAPVKTIDIEHTNIASKNKNKVKQQKSTGFIANLATDTALLTAFTSRKFDGYINQPIVKHQHGKITKAVVHLATKHH
jgi:predicted amidohydrolase